MTPVITSNAMLRQRAEERRGGGETVTDAVRTWIDRHVARTEDGFETRDEWLSYLSANLVADPELAPHLAHGEKERVVGFIRNLAMVTGEGVISRVLAVLAGRIEDDWHWTHRRPVEPITVADDIAEEIARLSDEAIATIIAEAGRQDTDVVREQERRNVYEYLKVAAEEIGQHPRIDPVIARNNMVRVAGEILRGLHDVPKINNPELWK